MASRIALVTGGTSGVGRSVAAGLAGQGFRVVITSRSHERGEEAAQEIQRRTDDAEVDAAVVDLTRLEDIRRFSERFHEEYSSLHVLSNNAAVLPMRRSLTRDGLEMIFGVNYLGHFLLTHLLDDLLKSGAPSRVLTVSGGPSLIQLGRPRLDDIQMKRFYNPFTATLRAAALKVAFSYELARRLEGTGVTSNTFHPGMVKSNLERHFPQPLRWLIGFGASLFFSETSETGIYAAASPGLETVTGRFFVNMRMVDFHPRWMTDSFLKDLWDRSEVLAGLA